MYRPTSFPFSCMGRDEPRTVLQLEIVPELTDRFAGLDTKKESHQP